MIIENAIQFKNFRLMLGFTQKEFAKWLNVNELTIRRLESGETPIKNSSTVRILLLNLKLLELDIPFPCGEPSSFIKEEFKKLSNKIREYGSLPYSNPKRWNTMSLNTEPDWAPIEVSEQLRESCKCPVCGKSYFNFIKNELEEYRTGKIYELPHIPNEIIVTCDNEKCEACDEDFEVKLRVLILPLE